MSKFKYKDEVRIINIDFYEGCTGEIIRHDGSGGRGSDNETFTVRLDCPSYNTEVSLHPNNLENLNEGK